MLGHHMILIGFMGAGKTRVGRELADRYQKELIDTDQRIEAIAGMSISRLFEVRGEPYFRMMETKVLEELLHLEAGQVIATGGGLPMREENRKLLHELGTVIYLQVDAGTILQRLQGDETRPLLQGEGAEEKIHALLSDREPIYRGIAHRIVKVDHRTPEEIADEIVQSMKKGEKT
ncbi:MAG: shikimate kinase [Hungatella sp.]